MKDFRFIYVVTTSFFWGIVRIPFANHMIANKERYSIERRSRFAYKIMDFMKRRGHVNSDIFGYDNLPKDENYILYSNHQGKYDALGVLLGLKGKPCGMLWEQKSSDRLMARQICGLLDGEPIDLTNGRAMVTSIGNVVSRVRNGLCYLIFPEGGYKDNKNNLQEFKSGCFACSLQTKTPIVPVAIYDSYKGMNGNSLKHVVTQVHYLKSIAYDEYKDLNKKEICELVKSKIAEKLAQIEAGELFTPDFRI